MSTFDRVLFDDDHGADNPDDIPWCTLTRHGAEDGVLGKGVPVVTEDNLMRVEGVPGSCARLLDGNRNLLGTQCQ